MSEIQTRLVIIDRHTEIERYIQDTSRMAYRELDKTKVESTKKMIIQFLKNNYPLSFSDKEIAFGLMLPERNWENVRKRRVELAQEGRIEYAGNKQCSITKKEVMSWRAR